MCIRRLRVEYPVTLPDRLAILGLMICGTCLPGCMSPWFRPKDPGEQRRERREEIRDTLKSDQRPKLIRDVAVARTPTVTRLENIAIVSGLNGTGGDAKPSTQRDKLLNEMRRRDVARPNQFIQDSSTAMVTAEVIVPPAATKMERLDVQVKLSKQAEGTDLRGGWLMETSLAEASLLGGQVQEGFEAAMAQGALVTRAQSTGSDTLEDKCLGLVVGGGLLLKDRPIGIDIRSDFADAVTMAAIAPAINKRFTVFTGQKHIGAATPETAGHIDLKIPADYRFDPVHFTNIVMHLGFLETAEQQAERIELCRSKLLDPTTARDAAWQLEAIGKAGIPALAEAVSNSNPEIRFYAAHSLAYLQQEQAVVALAELAKTEPAFRAMALNGLAVMKQFSAGEALAELLHSDDIEARYGAVLALRKRDASDPQVRGIAINNVGHILQVPSRARAAVAISLTMHPEVAIFGDNPKVRLSAFEYLNPHLLLSAKSAGKISISYLTPGKQDRVTEVNDDVRSVLVGISEVGGNYGDWVAFLSKCHRGKLTDAIVAINPVPTAGRVYQRSPVSAASYQSESLLPDALQSGTTQQATEACDQVPQDERKSAVAATQWYNPWSWWN